MPMVCTKNWMWFDFQPPEIQRVGRIVKIPLLREERIDMQPLRVLSTLKVLMLLAVSLAKARSDEAIMGDLMAGR